MVNSLKLLLLSLFLSFTANAAYLPGMKADDIMCGGRLISGSGLIIYHAEFEGSSTQGSSFYKMTSAGALGSGASAVTTGKTFIAKCARIDSQAASATGAIMLYLAYGDSFVTNTSPPANIVGMISAAASGVRADSVFGAQIIGGQTVTREIAINGSVPQNKYPFIYGQTTGQVYYVTLYGHEI